MRPPETVKQAGEHMSLADIKSITMETFECWNAHNAPRLGAALAYYSLLSMAPLTILVVAICGLVFRHSAEQEVLEQTRAYLGGGGADTLRMLLANAHHPKAGIVASAIAILMLLFGASGVFSELQSSLNAIWDVAPANSGRGIRGIVLQRLAAFLMVVELGILLLLSLLVTAGLAIARQFAASFVPIPPVAGQAIEIAVSLAILVVFFALLYKFVPDVPIEWRDVWIGAVVTAILFILGKMLLTIYFSTAALGSTYGAAGSLVALVVWVYYSAQIFFFGAVFTRIFARRFGSRKASKQQQIARSTTA